MNLPGLRLILLAATLHHQQTGAATPATTPPPPITLHRIKGVPPKYPAMARSEHVSGVVKLGIIIDTDGHVSEAKPVSGPTLLYAAAQECVLQWVYEPVQKDGKPARVSTNVSVTFGLQ